MIGDYVRRMRWDDMDGPALREVYNLIRTRQGQAIDHLIARYNGTYFRELMWTLEKRAWQMMMDPDVLRRVTGRGRHGHYQSSVPRDRARNFGHGGPKPD